jgi:FkbM family methyltransferase
MRRWDDLVITRQEEVDGLGPWYWLKGDLGAWTGPRHEWPAMWDKVNQHVRDWSVAVQAGGCQGMYPRLLARRFKTVYTWEPDCLNFHVLSLNTQVDNIVKFNAALGDGSLSKVERADMVNTGMHVVKDDPEGTIPRMRVDDLNLRSCGLIMLDVEGTEHAALQGAMNTIMKYRPVVSVETVGQNVSGLLEMLGYRDVGRGSTDTFYVSH